MSYLRDHEPWRQKNLAILRASGLAFTERADALIFREPGKPRVDFYPATGRWRVVGEGPDRRFRAGQRGEDGRTFRGQARAFLAWYAKQAPPSSEHGGGDGDKS